MSKEVETFKGYRFPKSIIRYGVWLYHRFLLSLRDVEEILLQRGIKVSYETIREWGLKFGPHFAHEIKRRAPRRGDTWHLDEVCLVIN